MGRRKHQWVTTKEATKLFGWPTARIHYLVKTDKILHKKNTTTNFVTMVEVWSILRFVKEHITKKMERRG